MLAACGVHSYAPSAASGSYSIAGMAPPPAIAAPAPAQGTEPYADYGVNPQVDASRDRISTFAVDVDNASYTITRRKLKEGTLPPYQAVRAEEYINFFDYGYSTPAAGAPFAVDIAAAPSPLEKGHEIVRVGVQGKRVSAAERKHVHGSVREVLKPTGIDQKAKILSAIDDLNAGGSTVMSSGIELAYKLASQTFVPGEVSRVVVLSDGDANVGSTSHEEILQSIAQYKDKGITPSTVGFGSGNYKYEMLEQLADKGDGHYVYIDSEEQARHVFAEATDGLLQVIARDVKVQVEFDPEVVKTYRLMGYENRDVADKDFRNDKVDGGAVGEGHEVTALHDVVFQPNMAARAPLTVHLRYKGATGGQATEQAYPMATQSVSAAPASLRFATAVASFADVLRKSPYAGSFQLTDIARIANASTEDRQERKEFVQLVGKANELGGGDKALAKN